MRRFTRKPGETADGRTIGRLAVDTPREFSTLPNSQYGVPKTTEAGFHAPTIIRRQPESLSSALSTSSAASVSSLLTLQQSYGNSFTQKFLEQRLPSAPEYSSPEPSVSVQTDLANGEAQAPGGKQLPPAQQVLPATSDLVVSGNTGLRSGDVFTINSQVAKKESLSTDSDKIQFGNQIAELNSSPEQDSQLKSVMHRLEMHAQGAKKHEPSARKVATARAASNPPVNDRSSRAAINQIELMSHQEVQKPEKDDFLKILRAEIARITPNSLEDADNFKRDGKVSNLKEMLTVQVDRRKDAASENIRNTTQTLPDPDSVESQNATPLRDDNQEAPLPDLQTQHVLPRPKSIASISVDQNKKKADQLMADNNLDEEQLEKANEPQFSSALEARRELLANVLAVPEIYRNYEQDYLYNAREKISQEEIDTTQAIGLSRINIKDKVKTAQNQVKNREEQERKRLADKIETIYAATRQRVETKLSGLDNEVSKLFETGEKAAREKFENDVDSRMSSYKFDRYLKHISGPLLWAKDKLLGMPDEVNKFYQDGRELYLKEMEFLFVSIANTVEVRLNEAKTDITVGKKEIKEYVQSLPQNIRKFADEAEENIDSRFGELQQSVDNKKTELARNVASRHQESRNKLNDYLVQLKSENIGLVDKFAVEIKKVVDMLQDFRNRIAKILGQAGGLIQQIIKDPVSFLSNLIKAVKLGVGMFSQNILSHLKSGLAGWVFGALSGAGIEIPSEFNLKAIFGLVLQVLGITNDRLYAKASKLIGEKNLTYLKKVWEYISVLITEGPAGLWIKVKEYLGDLRETVFSGIREWVITQIIKQGVIWLVSLFNPASALIKAVQAIYNVFTFFVERAQQIAQLVEAVIESVAKIVAGQVDDAANWIEKAMGRSVSPVIGLLANLLGLNGVSDKIKSIIDNTRQKVDGAIDKVILKVVNTVKKTGKSLLNSAGTAVSAITEWWKKRQKVGEGDNQHTLYFDGDKNDAELFIESRKTKLELFIAGLKEDPQYKSQLKVKAINEVEKLLPQIQKSRAALRQAKKSKNQQKNIASQSKKLEQLFDDVGAKLGIIFKGDDYGTKDKPIPIDWPGPESKKYPTLYFGGRINTPKSQKEMEKVGKPDKTGVNIVEYEPEEPKTLPGGERIGISDKYKIYVGAVVGPLVGGEETPGGGKLRNALTPYGWGSADSAMFDLDHVREIQFGGVKMNDKIENLWPLEGSKNRSKGSSLSRQKVQYPEGHEISMADLKKVHSLEVEKKKKFYFKVNSTKN